MYRPTEIETAARRTSIGDFRSGLLSRRRPEVTLDCCIGGSNKRLLVVVGSERTEAQCLEFARQFTSGGSAEIHVIKPTSADSADEVRRRAIALEVDWLCMVTHGGPGLMTLFLKSEDEKILRAVPCPVVCIPDTLRRGREAESTDRALRPIKRILVPINSPADNRYVMAYTVALAERVGAKIDLLGVEELAHRPFDSSALSFSGVRRVRRLAVRDELAALADEVVPKRLCGRKVVELGFPLFYATTRAARELQSDLIVLAVPTRRWNANARIDGGTERILRGASCPVVCIPERNARTDAAPHQGLSVALLRDRRGVWPMPARRPESPHSEPILAHRERETGVEQSTTPTFMTPTKPKLLVVDDDHSVRESLKKLLETEHYDVHPARDGVAALDYFKSKRTDLVVLNLNLGTDDGWKVFHTMREMNPFVPTVIITAEFDQHERAVTAGVEALIEKPIDVPVFLKIISELLAETSQQRLERACGDGKYCRYVARHYESLLKLLNERHSAPLKFSTALNAALPTLS